MHVRRGEHPQLRPHARPVDVEREEMGLVKRPPQCDGLTPSRKETMDGREHRIACTCTFHSISSPPSTGLHFPLISLPNPRRIHNTPSFPTPPQTRTRIPTRPQPYLPLAPPRGNVPSKWSAICKGISEQSRARREGGTTRVPLSLSLSVSPRGSGCSRR